MLLCQNQSISTSGSFDILQPVVNALPQPRGRLLDCMTLSLASWLCCVFWHHFDAQINHGAAHSCHEALLSHVYCNGYCDVSLDLNIVSGQEIRFVRVYDPNTVAAFLPVHSVSLFRRGMHQAPKCQVMSYQVTLQLPAPASSSDKRFYPVTLYINPPTCRGYESRPSWKLYRAHHYTTQQVCLGSGDSLLIDFFNVSYLT